MAAAQVTCLSLMLLPRAETNPDEAHSRMNEQVLEGDKLHQSFSGPCGDEDFE
jgi:hypothetical protein